MARVFFKKGQAIQSLSGTAGKYTFRSINGKTFIRRAKERTLPENATRKEKALFKRESMIDQCTAILQNEMKDIQEAIRMRVKIRSRLRSLYEKYKKEIKAPTKLQRRIMEEYRGKWDTPQDLFYGRPLAVRSGKALHLSEGEKRRGEKKGKGRT